MANIKITDLTAYGNPTSTDVLPIVDVGADVTKKVSVADLLKNDLGTAAAPSIAFDGDPNTGIYSPGADQVAISTNGTERVSIDSSGRLLVGTSSAREVSFVNANLQLEGTTYEDSTISLTRNSSSGALDCGVFAFGRSRGSGTTIVQANDRLGTITFCGADNTDLNTSAATIDVFVDGTPGADDMPGRLVFSTTADSASSPTERMRITSDGIITTNGAFVTTSSGSEEGIALDQPNNALYGSRVNDPCVYLRRLGSDGDVLILRKSTTTVGSISVTTSATAYNTSSDYRLKENIVPLTGAVDRLNQLQVHRFNFIADPGTTVNGFIAHEAQAVVPECVTGTKDEVDDEGNPVYQGIDQSKLVPLLTAALQEAIGRIETLEAEVAALKGV